MTNLSNFCHLYGRDDGHPLILVHGATVSQASWVQQIDDLGREYRLAAVDLPGHGGLAGEPFQMERAVDILCRVMDQVMTRPMLFVGMSLGGHVATLAAARYPDRTAGLAIAGASMNFHGLTGAWTRFAGWMMLRLFSENRLRASLQAKIRQAWPAAAASAQLAEGVWPLGAAQSFAELPRYDFRAEMARLCAPVLILNGEHDRPNRKGAPAFAAAARQARVEVIPGAGHACAVEQPQAFNARLCAFAQECFVEKR